MKPLNTQKLVLYRLMFIRDFDIGDSIQCLRYYAGWADKIIGQVGADVSIAHVRYSSHCLLRAWRLITKQKLHSRAMILLAFVPRCTPISLYSPRCSSESPLTLQYSLELSHQYVVSRLSFPWPIEFS